MFAPAKVLCWLIAVGLLLGLIHGVIAGKVSDKTLLAICVGVAILWLILAFCRRLVCDVREIPPDDLAPTDENKRLAREAWRNLESAFQGDYSCHNGWTLRDEDRFETWPCVRKDGLRVQFVIERGLPWLLVLQGESELRRFKGMDWTEAMNHGDAVLALPL